MRRRDGVLIIGYGHSQTARPGVSITEAEAELLLFYDLMPVIDAIHTHVKSALNQHQFDALASFILSIGVDRFTRSDVLSHLNKGSTVRAAQALSGWPDKIPLPVDAPYRRRAAERALFEVSPDQSGNLDRLLLAPVTGAAPRSPFQNEVPAPDTIPVLRHEKKPGQPKEPLDPSALAFVGVIGTLAVAAGALAFHRSLPPFVSSNQSLWLGGFLVLVGMGFVVSAAWNLLLKRDNKSVI